MKVSAIIPAAGQSRRMGLGTNKQFLTLGGKPVLAHTLAVFENCLAVQEIIVVAAPGEEEYCSQEIVRKYNFSKVFQVITGGRERQDSVYQGILALSSDTDLVVVHDGARLFLTAELIEESINHCQETGAAIVAVPVKDTIKIVNEEHTVENTPPRNILWAVQTPQTFSYSLLKKAHQEAKLDGFLGTDDASLVERLGGQVRVVLGSYENLKITTPEDLIIGEAILRRRLEKCE